MDMDLLSDKALEILDHTLNSDEFHLRYKTKVAIEVINRIGVCKKADNLEDHKHLTGNDNFGLSDISKVFEVDDIFTF